MYTLIFFFKDTAPTEIYPYGPTLSLHDALPIYLQRTGLAARRFHLPHGLGQRVEPSATADDCRAKSRKADGESPAEAAARTCDDDDLAVQVRSEEHTSELQSLMRISYAVFCLKKKNTLQTNHHNYNNTKS